MARLYKMTLYVCDLVNSVDLDSIKTLIKQDALDSVSVNCICHFANEEIGAEVEWDDDIDLNRCGSPTSVWEKYFKPKTDAEKKWIPATEPPNHGDIALCRLRFNEMRILQWDNISKWWLGYGAGNDWRQKDVTHWMPLPEPPKED